MNVAISDEDKNYLYHLKKKINIYFSNHKPHTIKSYSPNDLYEYLENKGCHYDAVLMDVHMGDCDGVEIARKINDLNPYCNIIFVSSQLEWVKDIFDVSQIYFLLKSELDEKLPKALSKAESLMKEQLPDYYVNLKCNGKTYYIPTRDIIYIEVNGRKIYVHTTKGVYTTNNALKRFSQNLPGDFIRTHNSFLVNVKHILTLERTCCHLTNGATVPISRTYKNNLNEAFFR